MSSASSSLPRYTCAAGRASAANKWCVPRARAPLGRAERRAHLPIFQLDRHRVPLRVVQHLDGDPYVLGHPSASVAARSTRCASMRCPAIVWRASARRCAGFVFVATTPRARHSCEITHSEGSHVPNTATWLLRLCSVASALLRVALPHTHRREPWPTSGASTATRRRRATWATSTSRSTRRCSGSCACSVGRSSTCTSRRTS